MTFSALISGTIPHHDKYNTRPGKVTRAIQHHWADVTMGGEQSLASPRRRASVNYLVHNDGLIIGQVPEEFRPWTSSSSAADNPSITIECQNQTVGPEWRVSDAALNSIARLLADIATRHSFGLVTRTNYRGHREFASTACPGPYLYPRLQSLCDAANVIKGVHPVVNPTPHVLTQEDDMLPLILWCYTTLVGRTVSPSTDEIENWVTGTAGWNSAQVLDAFLGAPCEPGGVVRAYCDYLGREPESKAAIDAHLVGRPTIRQVRMAIQASDEAKARR